MSCSCKQKLQKLSDDIDRKVDKVLEKHTQDYFAIYDLELEINTTDEAISEAYSAACSAKIAELMFARVSMKLALKAIS